MNVQTLKRKSRLLSGIKFCLFFIVFTTNLYAAERVALIDFTKEKLDGKFQKVFETYLRENLKEYGNYKIIQNERFEDFFSKHELSNLNKNVFKDKAKSLDVKANIVILYGIVKTKKTYKLYAIKITINRNVTDVLITHEFDSLKHMESDAKNISKEIKKHITGEVLKTSIYASYSHAITFGKLNSIIDTNGFGANVGVQFSNFLIKDLFFNVEANFYRFLGSANNKDRAFFIPLTAGAGFKFWLTDWFSISPLLLLGANIQIFEHQGYWGFDLEEGEKRTIVNFLLKPTVNFEFRINEYFGLFLRLAYNGIIEKSNYYQYANANFGFYITF